jgi:hypothetical protein
VLACKWLNGCQATTHVMFVVLLPPCPGRGSSSSSSSRSRSSGVAEQHRPATWWLCAATQPLTVRRSGLPDTRLTGQPPAGGHDRCVHSAAWSASCAGRFRLRTPRLRAVAQTSGFHAWCDARQRAHVRRGTNTSSSRAASGAAHTRQHATTAAGTGSAQPAGSTQAAQQAASGSPARTAGGPEKGKGCSGRRGVK